MSSTRWEKNRLFQRVGTHDEELGYVELDQNSNTYVLWLKDTCGVLGLNGGYIRGEEFCSMASAKEKDDLSPSAWILHYIWMRNVVEKETIHALDEHWDEISQNLPDDVTKDNCIDSIKRHIKELAIEKMPCWVKKATEKSAEKAIFNWITDWIKNLSGG